MKLFTKNIVKLDNDTFTTKNLIKFNNIKTTIKIFKINTYEKV